MKRLLCFTLILLVSCGAPTPTAAAGRVLITPARTPTAGALAPLLPITNKNAGRVHLLATLKFSGYINTPVDRCSASFNPQGSVLLAACGSEPVSAWEVASGSLLFTLDTGGGLLSTCAFDPMGERVACAGEAHALTLWDGATGEKLREFAGDSAARDLAFTADGSGLVTCGTAEGLRLWNTVDGSEAWRNSQSAGCRGLDLSAFGKTIAYGSESGAVGLVDAATGELLQEWKVSDMAVEDVVFDSAGRRLAAGSADTLVRILRVRDGVVTGTWHGHYHAVRNLVFSADDSLLISSGLDNTVRVWDVEQGVILKITGGHEAVVVGSALSPDGSLIATIGTDGAVRLWGAPKE